MKRTTLIVLAIALAASSSMATDPSVLKFKIGAFSTRDGMPSYRRWGLERTDPVKGGERAYYLVQFAGPVTDLDRAALVRYGGRVFDYIPNHAHVVQMTEEQRASAAKAPGVVFTGYFQPAFRIDPDLLEPQVAYDVEEPGRIMLNVQTFEVADRAVVRDRLLAAHADARFLKEDGGGRIFQVSVPAAQSVAICTEIANYPESRWVERLGVPVLHNAWSRWINQSRDTTGMGSSGSTWAAKLRIKSADDSLKMPLYRRGLYGQGQIVGDDDTGMDYDNIYFRDPGGLKPVYDRDTTTANGHDTLVYGTNAHRKIVAYNVWADTQDLNSSGHGSHTSGSIAADSINSTHNGALSDTVLARVMGMAPMARIAFTDIGGASDGLYTPANLNSIYRWEYNAGARITSSSWGYNPGQSSSYGSFEEQLDTLAWSHPDLIMFRSAGNSNTSNDSVNWPACGKNIVCVGANESGFGTGTSWAATGVTTRNEIRDVAEFSSHGPTRQGLRRPHILASGGWYIWSVDSDGNLGSNNTGYTYMGGTSMSTPTAAGLCAQLRQYLTEGWWKTGTKQAGDAIANPSGALMKALMILSTRNTPGAYSTDALNNTGTKNVPSQGQGWGAVVMDDALYFSGDARKLRLQTAQFTASGQSHSYTITTGVSTDTMNPFKVVLVYYDYPSALSPMDISVNNLNLTVTIGANTYLGNVFGTNGKSATGGTADTTNPEEVVWLLPAAAKSNQVATITVTAATLNRTPQPYAIVVGGDISTSSGFLGVSFSQMAVMQRGDAMEVFWRTESEQDCYRWDVERSRFAGHSYRLLGSVPGHGTTGAPTEYSFTDGQDLEPGTYCYRLIQVDLGGQRTEYGPVEVQYGGGSPLEYSLGRCLPNPVRHGMTVRYTVRNAGHTSLDVYNVIGQKVRALVEGRRLPGTYAATWDGRDAEGLRVAGGVYFCMLRSGGYSATERLVVLH
jgi:hypothetical protein